MKWILGIAIAICWCKKIEANVYEYSMHLYADQIGQCVRPWLGHRIQIDMTLDNVTEQTERFILSTRKAITVVECREYRRKLLNLIQEASGHALPIRVRVSEGTVRQIEAVVNSVYYFGGIRE